MRRLIELEKANAAPITIGRKGVIVPLTGSGVHDILSGSEPSKPKRVAASFKEVRELDRPNEARPKEIRTTFSESDGSIFNLDSVNRRKSRDNILSSKSSSEKIHIAELLKKAPLNPAPVIKEENIDTQN